MKVACTSEIGNPSPGDGHTPRQKNGGRVKCRYGKMLQTQFSIVGWEKVSQIFDNDGGYALILLLYPLEDILLMPIDIGNGLA